MYVRLPFRGREKECQGEKKVRVAALLVFLPATVLPLREKDNPVDHPVTDVIFHL